MHAWQEELMAFMKASGASLVGCGSLSDVPAAREAGFSGAVSIGVALNPSIVRELGKGPTLAYHEEYYRINGILDQLDQLAADWLISQGFDAHPMTRDNVIIDWETLKTQLPHKTAARRAGHGWIGRSALIITPEYGSAIRFSTVLTNAPITSASVPEDRCGSCRRCQEACPVDAIAGVPWTPALKREHYYNAFACKAFAQGRCEKLGVHNDICGICIHACPYSQKYIRLNSDENSVI